MARRQRHKLFAARVEERIGDQNERGDALLRNRFECRLNLGISAGAQDVYLQTKGQHRLVHFF